MKLSRKGILAVYCFIAIVIDQVTKVMVQSNFFLGESKEVIGGLFNITYVLNSGAAFGILRNQDPMIRKVVLLAAAVLACAFIITLLKKEFNYKLRAFGYVTVLAGAVGNVIDRIRFNRVVDFLDVYYGQHHWPTFNVADCYITIGVILIIIDMLILNRSK